MSLEQELSDYIKQNGLKKSFVADELGMTSSKLSSFLHRRLIVTEDVENRVRRYLEKHK